LGTHIWKLRFPFLLEAELRNVCSQAELGNKYKKSDDEKVEEAIFANQ
jgi:hypothetical protein